MSTSSPRTDSPISTLVSRLENFFATTRPRSIPSRSTIFCAKSGWDDPLKTLMLGILPPVKLRPANAEESVLQRLSLSKNRARLLSARPKDGISYQNSETVLHL